MTHYGNFPHKDTDDRPDECYRYGGIRCGHIDGRCNKLDKFQYDDSWEKEAKRLQELLKAE